MKRPLVSLVLTLLLFPCLLLPAGAYDMGVPTVTNPVSAGLSHSAYVDLEGNLWVWGSNLYGQLGLEGDGAAPVKVMSDVASVCCGADFTLALKTDGTLWAFGGNDYGQLGTGDTEARAIPVQVGYKVTAISAGDYHCAVLREDGTLWTWGDNLYGQLGAMPLTSRLKPVRVMYDVAAVAAGAGFTAALKTDGTLWTFGDNLYGQLGDGSTAARATPRQVMEDVAAMAAGGYHTTALKTDGTLWAWGSNIDGQLGNGEGGAADPEHDLLKLEPAQVSLSGSVAAVSAGAGHTMAILSDGTLWAWGRNDSGQLGLADQDTQVCSTPTQVAGITNAVALSAGVYHTLCLQADGTLWSWGLEFAGSGEALSAVSQARQPVQVDFSGAARQTIDLTTPAPSTADGPEETTPLQFLQDNKVPLAILALAVVVLAVVLYVWKKRRPNETES